MVTIAKRKPIIIVSIIINLLYNSQHKYHIKYSCTLFDKIKTLYVTVNLHRFLSTNYARSPITKLMCNLMKAVTGQANNSYGVINYMMKQTGVPREIYAFKHTSKCIAVSVADHGRQSKKFFLFFLLVLLFVQRLYLVQCKIFVDSLVE